MNEWDLKSLRLALSLFHEDGDGCYMRSELISLESNYLANFRVNSPLANVKEYGAIGNIQHGLWQISALIQRLVWMRRMARSGELHESVWRVFSQLDIEQYFVQLRSIMDYLGVLIRESSKNPGQIPRSFQKLRSSIDSYERKIHPEIYEIVSSALWFDEIRAIRDSLVHDGARPMVFSEDSDRLLFQVHRTGLRNMISKPFILRSENVACFERFAAWSLSHALSALECVGACLSENAQFQIDVGPVRSNYPGLNIARDWMEDLLQRLEASV